MNKLHILTINACILLGIFACADHITESAETVFDDATQNSFSIQPRFSSIQDSVFAPSCAISGCHNGTVPPNLSSGLSYDRIVDQPNSQTPGLDRIEPASPQQSYLYLKLTGDDNIIGSRMPTRSPPLSRSIVDSIRVWIQNGAPRD